MNGLAEALVLARRRGDRLMVAPGEPIDLQQAYRTQDRVRELLRASIGGWKVARTPDGEVISAPIFADAIVASTNAIPRMHAPDGFECELAFGVSQPLAAKMSDYVLDDVIPTLGFVCAAFELLACRAPRGFQSARPLLVADNLGNGGVVLGERRTDWRDFDLTDVELSLSVDDAVVVQQRRGKTASSPLEAVVALANHLRRRGLGWEPGHVVITGALAGVHRAVAGQRVVAKVHGLSPVAMSIAAIRDETRNDTHVGR
jgi:2-keto-4-pentenoate hydratase